jgi:hypothetical protein
VEICLSSLEASLGSEMPVMGQKALKTLLCSCDGIGPDISASRSGPWNAWSRIPGDIGRISF